VKSTVQDLIQKRLGHKKTYEQTLIKQAKTRVKIIISLAKITYFDILTHVEFTTCVSPSKGNVLVQPKLVDEIDQWAVPIYTAESGIINRIRSKCIIEFHHVLIGN
jgi:hypothetical protein